MVALELETGWGVPGNTPRSSQFNGYSGRLSPQSYPRRDVQNLNPLPPLPPISLLDSDEHFLAEAKNVIRDKPDATARLKINYITRDKALSVLQQYNQLLLEDPNKPKKLPKGHKITKHRGNKLDFVFTEGISSISKTEAPSFLLPKENILHANLPKHIDVRQHKDQFSLSFAPKRRQDANKLAETEQFKNIKMLGVENLGSVSIAEHMKKRVKENHKDRVKADLAGFKSPSTYNSFSTTRVHPPLKKGSIKSSVSSNFDGLESVKSLSTQKGSIDSKRTLANARRKIQKGSVKLVSIGDQIEKYSKPLPKRFNPSSLPLFDWRIRMQEQYKRARFVPGREISNGMYSLTNTKKHTNVHVLPPITLDTSMPKQYPQNIGHKKIGEGGIEGLMPSKERRYNHVRNSRSITPSSSCTLNSNLQPHNPPPSFVSSSDDEMPRKELINEMFPVLEEGIVVDGDLPKRDYNKDLESRSVNSTTEHKTPRDLHSSLNIPKVVIGNGDIPLGSSFKPRVDKHSTRSEFKNPSPNRHRTGTPHTERSDQQSVSQASNPFGMLTVPLVSLSKEARPPMSDDLSQDKGQTTFLTSVNQVNNFPKASELIDLIDKRHSMPREHFKGKRGGEEDALFSDTVDMHRLSVQNLQLLDKVYTRKPNSEEGNVYKNNVELYCNSLKNVRNCDSNHSDDFGSQYSKKTNVSTKNMVFRSPLAPATNAKRI